MVPNPIGWDEAIAPTSLGFETFGQAGNWCRYICRRISFSWGHTHGSRPVFSAGLAIARTIVGQRNRKRQGERGSSHCNKGYDWWPTMARRWPEG